MMKSFIMLIISTLAFLQNNGNYSKNIVGYIPFL